jgi:hypothetical protein
VIKSLEKQYKEACQSLKIKNIDEQIKQEKRKWLPPS